MKKTLLLASLLTAAAMQGCAIGKSSFSCSGIPEGVTCMSAKEVYNATNRANTLAVERKGSDSGEDIFDSSTPQEATKQARTQPDPAPTVDKPIPVRSQAKIMRYWVAPHETESGDFSAGGLYFREIEERKWNFAATNVPGAPASMAKTISPLRAVSPRSQMNQALIAPLRQLAAQANNGQAQAEAIAAPQQPAAGGVQ